uniref:Small ribosomal subunit protein uS14 n=1 Tax=Gopherus agassizii TaxID=38772 RepID=A0A452J4D2_9SAUR
MAARALSLHDTAHRAPSQTPRLRGSVASLPPIGPEGHPRKFGQGSRSCRMCSNRHGLICKYGLNMCRQCFRQYAKDIGFIKLD